jgi:hypothetical protein
MNESVAPTKVPYKNEDSAVSLNLMELLGLFCSKCKKRLGAVPKRFEYRNVFYLYM